jgi:hypothetical protein
MAVQQGYGKMAGANSLVFAYDSTDTNNSFKGAPTTNLAATLSTYTIDGSGQGTVGTFTSVDGNNHYKIVDVNSNTRLRKAFTSITAGVPYTFSVEYKKLAGAPTLRFQIQGRSNSLINVEFPTTSQIGIEDKEGWQRAQFTFTPGTGSTNIFWYIQDGDDYTTYTHSYELRNPQVEQKSYATPFVQGTRSNEQAILDLTGNHTVDVSTLDFTNGFELDGTNDHMTFNLTKTPNMTFEFITNFSGDVTTGQMVFNAGNTSAGPDLYMACGKLNWNIWDGCNNPFANIPGSWDNGKNHHVVLVNDQTNNITKLYYDGTLLGTASYRQCTADRMSIGGDGSGYNYQGNLPLFKVYSEALTEAQVQSNFKNYRKRFEGLDYHIDDTTDGGGWIRWWWYTGVGWPGHEPEALGHPFGTFDSSSHYGFQRLPEGLEKEQVELLAKDGDGNIYKWDFASPSVIAQYVWDSFTQGTQGTWRQDGDAWNPIVIAGAFHGRDQDAWKYRVSEGVASFLLDDDGCDCLSTLNAGHAMCGSSWQQQYAQPDGAYLRYGVDTLNDGGCLGPLPERTLELYYRLK